MKKMLFVLFLLVFPKLKLISQNSYRDSLKSAIVKAGDRYSTDAINLVQKLNYNTGISNLHL
jgi:hypothetical protein